MGCWPCEVFRTSQLFALADHSSVRQLFRILGVFSLHDPRRSGYSRRCDHCPILYDLGALRFSCLLGSRSNLYNFARVLNGAFSLFSFRHFFQQGSHFGNFGGNVGDLHSFNLRGVNTNFNDCSFDTTKMALGFRCISSTSDVRTLVFDLSETSSGKPLVPRF